MAKKKEPWEVRQEAQKKQRAAAQLLLKKSLTPEQYTLMMDMFKIVNRVQSSLSDANDVWMSDVIQLTNIWYGFGQYKNGVKDIIWSNDDA